ncbi:MAG: Rv2175c family DNA-binding protein [Canibacter sp.]
MLNVTGYGTTEFLTVPDLMEILDISPSKIHRLIEDHSLAATRIDGILSVPKDCILDGQVLSSLRGTIMQLLDQGFENDEVVGWLVTENDQLGARPIDELRAGKKAVVRRAAQLADLD